MLKNKGAKFILYVTTRKKLTWRFWVNHLHREEELSGLFWVNMLLRLLFKLALANRAIHLASELINTQRAGTWNLSGNKSSCQKENTMNASTRSNAVITKPLCHKTSASQECCCDTSALTVDKRVKHWTAHTHFGCQKGGNFNHSSPGLCLVFFIYLSMSDSVPPPNSFVVYQRKVLSLTTARCSAV